jgi:HK97 gp10 family phage protein
MIQIQITGQADIAKALDEISRASKGKIGLKAIITALTPIVDRAQELAPTDTGNLRDSIGFRTKAYRRGGHIFAVIGPRKGFRGPDGRLASKYAHLVEYGHTKKGGGMVAAQPFMRPAFAENSGKAVQDMARVFGEEIAIIARRKAKKRK